MRNYHHIICVSLVLSSAIGLPAVSEMKAAYIVSSISIEIIPVKMIERQLSGKPVAFASIAA